MSFQPHVWFIQRAVRSSVSKSDAGSFDRFLRAPSFHYSAPLPADCLLHFGECPARCQWIAPILHKTYRSMLEASSPLSRLAMCGHADGTLTAFCRRSAGSSLFLMRLHNAAVRRRYTQLVDKPDVHRLSRRGFPSVSAGGRSARRRRATKWGEQPGGPAGASMRFCDARNSKEAVTSLLLVACIREGAPLYGVFFGVGDVAEWLKAVLC